MRKFLIVVLVNVLLLSLLLCGCYNTNSDNNLSNENGEVNESFNNLLQGIKSEEYYMVTFVSEIEYWKGCYNGFEEAAKLYNVSTFYDGSPEYEVEECIEKLEEIIEKKPAGIALTCMDPDAYNSTIKKAMNEGIEVVCFDADAPHSGRYSFLATDNYEAGKIAAKQIASLIDNEGEVIVITLPNQLNHVERTDGFKDIINENYPEIKIVDILNGGSSKTTSAKETAQSIKQNPNVKAIFATDASSGTGVAAAVKEIDKVGEIKIVSFDTDRSTLDLIKEGTIDLSIAQGTWNMGFWSLQFLFQMKHNLINPTDNWQKKGINPLPRFVDTGVNIVNKENVEAFYID